MKSNMPRRNPSPNHLDTLRAEFEALTQRLQEAEAAANAAQQEADAKSRAYHDLEQRSHSTHWSVTEQRLYREKNQLDARPASRPSSSRSPVIRNSPPTS